MFWKKLSTSWQVLENNLSIEQNLSTNTTTSFAQLTGIKKHVNYIKLVNQYHYLLFSTPIYAPLLYVGFNSEESNARLHLSLLLYYTLDLTLKNPMHVIKIIIIKIIWFFFSCQLLISIVHLLPPLHPHFSFNQVCQEIYSICPISFILLHPMFSWAKNGDASSPAL